MLSVISWSSRRHSCKGQGAELNPRHEQGILATMPKDSKIAFIGAGNMSEALIAGLLKARTFQANAIFVTDVSKDRLILFEQTYGIGGESRNAKAVQRADIIVLAVKPQVLPEVLSEIKSHVKDSHLVISVAAGFPLSKIQQTLPSRTAVIRAMPNTPALVLEGATALAGGDYTTEAQLAIAQEIFQASGKVVVIEEKLMDAVTGLSGSGPAYVYVMIEALADGGVRMGLPRHIAQTLAVQTVLGTAKLLTESGEHPGILKDRVASPGGTTIAGLHELERGRIRATLMNAVEAATRRSQELGS
ncbi:MAG: pyrroline-5-carboxylate reductase [Nitrospirales bacterium]|nr:pyrroline-5-carboxylate reductase [Nitrospirales bacterium]